MLEQARRGAPKACYAVKAYASKPRNDLMRARALADAGTGTGRCGPSVSDDARAEWAHLMRSA